MRHLPYLLALAAACVAPFHFYPVFLTQVLCYALFASAFNLLFGFAGILSFGHAAFFGCGAYVAALLMKSPLAAPIYQVTPLMGSHIIVVVFAVVVIGGLGSILGTIVTGFALGVAEGLTKAVYPQAANLVIFVIMAVVLLATPAGLFGRR